MQPTELIKLLEATANPEKAAAWDKSGIQVWGAKQKIQRLAVTLDPTEEIIEKCINLKADFILTHHPLTLSPELPNKNNAYTRILRHLFQSGLWLYSAHTSLDTQTNGPVSWLAKKLKLTGITPVQILCNDQDPKVAFGYGIIGALPSETAWEKFSQLLRTILGIRFWSEIGSAPQKIRTIAYCPGSGMDLATQAFALGADLFISGDCKFHQAQEIGQLGFALDVGHFILEEKMMQTWADELQGPLTRRGIEVLFITGQNPILIQEGTEQKKSKCPCEPT